MFHARPPGIGPDLLEDLENAGGRKRALLGYHAFQGVEAEWVPDIRDVEVDQIGWARGFRGREYSFDEVAMGVEDGEPVAGHDVLPDHGFQERALARAGLADDVHRSPAVRQADAEDFVPVAEVCPAENGDGVVLVAAAGHSFMVGKTAGRSRHERLPGRTGCTPDARLDSLPPSVNVKMVF